MNKQKTLPITEARKQIFDLAEQVQKKGSAVILTERGKPKAALISADELFALQKTSEVKRRYPKLYDDMRRSDANTKLKRYVSLEEKLRKEGFLVSDSAKQKLTYGTNSIIKKSKKRI
jgi:prevent-host-death family protein